MFDLDTIRAMNRKQATGARRANVEPYVIESESEVDGFPPFPFPNIGDYRPKGWKLVNKYFVDSSGFGSNDEPALTTEQFKRKLKVGMGYAIIEEGQFQVYIGEFERR